MPPMALSIAATADCPCRKSSKYIVISPSEIAPSIVASAIQAYAP